MNEDTLQIMCTERMKYEDVIDALSDSLANEARIMDAIWAEDSMTLGAIIGRIVDEYAYKVFSQQILDDLNDRS